MKSISIKTLSISPATFLAPMAAVSDIAFRRLCRELGVGFVTTELVSIQGLATARGKSAEKSRHLLRTHPKERPRGVQLFGSDPELVADAAKIAVEEGADLIDFNMGCPVSKVCRLGAGAALLKDPIHAARLVEAAVSAVSVPVTVKMRAGWDRCGPSSIEIAKNLYNSGASAIAVHARTREQGYTGRADWTVIAAIKQAIPIPVIGNGDIFTPQDAIQMVQQTGCDGVMMGRGAMGFPMLLREVGHAINGLSFSWPPTIQERHATFLRHIELAVEHDGDRLPLEMRNHLLQYARGLSTLPQIRVMLPRLFTANDYRNAAEILFSGSISEPSTERPLWAGAQG